MGQGESTCAGAPAALSPCTTGVSVLRSTVTHTLICPREEGRTQSRVMSALVTWTIPAVIN
jgi:hypothetical protein